MTVEFTRKAKGCHVARITQTMEFALTNAGGGHGWALSLRDVRTHKILGRAGAGLTLSQAKAEAQFIVRGPKFGAALLKLALA